MTLVWSPETASKAYLDTIQTCGISSKTSIAEFLSAMAAGYNSTLIVEAWTKHEDLDITTSIGLAIAAKHTHGRHVCMVADEASRVKYVSAMQKLSSADVSLPEVVVGVLQVEEITRKMNNPIDFLVVGGGGRSRDFVKALITSVKLNQHGAILAFKRNTSTTLSWKEVILDITKLSVVRSITLPFGSYGLEIAYIASNIIRNTKSKYNPKRWIRHVDQESGEEHLIRR
ncbi:putative serine/threonine-protein kinase SAPK3-like [Capsicum annuum]|nr:putative serine/threonine-protein kinase SAPK3-like [Capsicum annuum]